MSETLNYDSIRGDQWLFCRGEAPLRYGFDPGQKRDEKGQWTEEPGSNDPVSETNVLYDSMSEGAKPHGGLEALEKKVDAHMDKLRKLPKEKLAEVWHRLGTGRAQKFPNKEGYIKAIRWAIISRAGSADRVNA